MRVDPLNLLIRTVVFSFVLVGSTAQPLLAGSVVNLPHDHPLGEILPGKSGEHAYFSLGNGRALKVVVSKVLDKAGSVKLESVSHDHPGYLSGKRFKKRRNVRW